MLKKNVRPQADGKPVELRIGDDIIIKMVIGEKNVQMAIDAPREMLIAFAIPPEIEPH